MRDHRQGRRRVPDRLRKRLSRRRADLSPLLLPVGDQRARPLVGVLHGHAPRDADQPELARLLRLGDRDDLTYEQKLARVPRACRRVLPGRRVRGVLRRAARPLDELAHDCSPRRTFDDVARRTPSAPRSRSTSTSTSSRTTAACSQRGRATTQSCRFLAVTAAPRDGEARHGNHGRDGSEARQAAGAYRRPHDLTRPVHRRCEAAARRRRRSTSRHTSTNGRCTRTTASAIARRQPPGT